MWRSQRLIVEGVEMRTFGRRREDPEQGRDLLQCRRTNSPAVRTEVPLLPERRWLRDQFAFSLGGVCALPAAQRGLVWSVRAVRSRSPRPARVRVVREGHGRPRSEATPARAAAGPPGPLGLDCVRVPVPRSARPDEARVSLRRRRRGRPGSCTTTACTPPVEGGVLELERLRVPQPQLDRPTELERAPAGGVRHGGHEFDSRESDAIGVVGKVESRPHGDLQHLTLGLGADPLAPTGEQQPFWELDVPVVVGRLPRLSERERRDAPATRAEQGRAS